MKGFICDFALKLLVWLNAKGLDWMYQVLKWGTKTWQLGLMLRWVQELCQLWSVTREMPLRCIPVGLDVPSIKVRYKNLTIGADVKMGSRALPTLISYTRDAFEVHTNYSPTLSLSLSLSHTHARTHTHTYMILIVYTFLFLKMIALGRYN